MSWTEPTLPGFEEAGHPQPIPDWLKPHVTTCRKCPEQIVFTLTTNRKTNPVDAHPSPDGNLIVYQDGGTVRSDVVSAADRAPDLIYHRSHFSTCPHADTFRKGTRTR